MSDAAYGSCLSRLADRMERAPSWPDRLEDPNARAGDLAPDPDDNPAIPAGYTYLLQLIAHDLVDTDAFAGPAGANAQDRNRDALAGARFNARARPLMLDTIYGMGPVTTPNHFAPSGSAGAARPLRTRLRTAPTMGAKPLDTHFCPFRDIARRTDAGSESGGSDPLVADARNDVHVMMSQLTVLFHTFHNLVVDALNAVEPARRPGSEQKQFECARAIVTLIYRRIVRDDVLPRILHPSIAAAYATRGQLPLRRSAEIPLEFSRGAFRFGHAMVRDEYRMNADRPLRTADALRLTSRRRPTAMPLTKDWMIDWARFFDLRPLDPSAPVPNWSARIGPMHAAALKSPALFPGGTTVERYGLPARDLATTLTSAIETVPRLVEAFHERLKATHPNLAGSLLRPYQTIWQPILASWLSEPELPPSVPRLSQAEIDMLAADPPLSFFVLIEAAFRGDVQPADMTGQGRTLGPLGSLIVAETIIGALEGITIVEGEWDLTLRDALRAVCTRHVGQPDAVPALTRSPEAQPPADMASLLAFLKTAGVFA